MRLYLTGFKPGHQLILFFSSPFSLSRSLLSFLLIKFSFELSYSLCFMQIAGLFQKITTRLIVVCMYLLSGKTHSWSSENSEHHSYSWYKNASESDRKPLAQTTTLKSEKCEDNDSFDAWGAIVGLGSRSTLPLSASRDSASSSWTSGRSLLTKRPAETSVTEVGQVDLDLPVEPSESEDHSQSSLRASNCRTYCRPNKSKPSTFGSTSNSEGAGSRKDGEGKSRGRTRDYTVLHPSSMSACNVTIQDSMERGMEEYTPSAPAADPGEAGRLRKKVEPETKPAR